MDRFKSIPWSRVESLLRQHEQTQAWLARRLNLATNVVTNWKRRDAVPMARADDVARAFGLSIDQLLMGLHVPDEAGKAARRIAARVGDLDRRGLLSRQAENAVMAFLDLLEGVAAGSPPKAR